jgi:Flp pilus assembly protein TadD
LVRFRLAFYLLVAARDVETEAEFRQAMELDENFFPVLANMSLMHALRGELAEALAFAEKACAAAPQVLIATGLLAGMLALSGDTSRVEAILEKLRPGQAYGAPRAPEANSYAGYGWH